MTHTPTPWIARGMGGDSIVLAKDHKWHREYPTREGFYPISVPRHYEDQHGCGRTDISGGFAHTDAQRIVACVNFFHGRDIPTERIAEGGIENLLWFVEYTAHQQCECADSSCPSCKACDLLTKLGVEP